MSKPFDPTYVHGVVELGRQGLSRAEIAARIGVPLAGLQAWMGERPDFAEAIALAETEARAWWDALPRDALVKGAAGFRVDVWSKAMAQRYGSPAHGPRHAKDAAEGESDTAEAPPRVELPRNGREARR